MLLLLPILTIPALIIGPPPARQLQLGLVVSLVLAVAIVAIGVTVLTWPRVVAAGGRVIGRTLHVVRDSVTPFGARVRPAEVLLAYVVAQALAIIPITPGGVGFVDAGLTTLLVLVGVPAQTALIGTLLYRLFSFWLPIPIGVLARAGWRLQRPQGWRSGATVGDRGGTERSGDTHTAGGEAPGQQ